MDCEAAGSSFRERPGAPRRGSGSGSSGVGGDIVVFTGTAHHADDIPPPHANKAYLAKYGESLGQVSGSAEESGRRFRVPLRIEITRTRGR
jgi:hypothetical protein